MTEPTMGDLHALLTAMHNQLTMQSERLTEIAAAVAAHDDEFFRVHDSLAATNAAAEHAANRVEVCIDALGAFRRDYLRRFPGAA